MFTVGSSASATFVLPVYSPLQALTHPSERDHELFNALANHNFRFTSDGEREALFTWARQILPDEANTIQFSRLRPALATRLRTQWDIHMVPSDLEFRYADLEGEVFQVREDWTILHLLEQYRPEWRTRQYNYLESSLLVPGTHQPFILRLTCHKVRQGAAHFKIFTHSNNERELFIEEISTSGISRCRDPEHFFYGLLGNWEWSKQTADYWRHHFEIPLLHGNNPYRHVGIETIPSPGGGGHVATISNLIGQAVIGIIDGSYGIRGTPRFMGNGGTHELPRRDPSSAAIL